MKAAGGPTLPSHSTAYKGPAFLRAPIFSGKGGTYFGGVVSVGKISRENLGKVVILVITNGNLYPR